MKKNLLIFSLIYFSTLLAIFAQTKSYGNYEVYTYETSRTGFSYLTMDVKFPSYLGGHKFNQKGIMYTHQYYSGEIGVYNFTNNFRMRFITEGNFNLGFGYSDTEISQILNSVYAEKIKLYTAKLDIYSLDIASEFTYVFKDGLALTAKIGLNIFSIGANVGFPENGRIKDDIFGVVNLVPLIIRPQFLIDFGRSVFGLGFLIHPKNFVEYKYVPPSIFNNDDKGIIFNDDFMSDFAIQLIFSY